MSTLDTTMPLPLSAEALIPHRAPMRLIDSLIAIDGQQGVVETLVPDESPLVDECGALDPVALVELLAQAYAAVHGYQDLSRGLSVRQGFLVGSRRVSILGRVRSGDLLQISIRTLGTLEGFAVAEGEVRCGDVLVAEGSVKLWVPGVVDEAGAGQ